MADLEQQLRTWVDAAETGVAPVTVDEVLDRTTTDPAPASRPGGRRRPLAIGLAAAAAVLVGALAVLVVRDDGADTVRSGHETSTTTPAPDAGWKTYTEPTLGWTMERPISSTVQSWRGLCELSESGSLITLSAQRRPVERQPSTSGCSTTWATDELAQPGFVALQVNHYVGGPYGPADHELDDPPTGIDFDQLRPEGSGDGHVVPGVDTVRALTKQVVIDGDHRFSVTAWIADDADPAVVADLRRVVGSIRWTGTGEDPSGTIDANATGDPRTSTILACMGDRGYAPRLELDPSATVDGEPAAEVVWGDGDQQQAGYADDLRECTAAGDAAADRFTREFSAWPDRDGPSQTAAEAERDGVVPEVAQLSLTDRGGATRFTDTTEGTWAITRMPNLAQGDEPANGHADADGCLGDRSGRYGVDYVCADEYGEVVLVDPDDGRLLRAFPLPGLPPTWLHVTKDAVFVGRVGDGGLPDNMIMRIDRRTLDRRVLVIPYDDGEAPPDLADLGTLDPAAMGWEAAPGDVQYGSLVGPEIPGGILVDSWVGVTMIDLPAIEDLFA